MLSNTSVIVPSSFQNYFPNIQAKSQRGTSLLLCVCIYFVYTAVFSLFVVIIPIISVVFPCLYNRKVYMHIFEFCESYQFRLFLYVLNTLLLFPIGVISSIGTVSMLASMNQLTNSLNEIKYLINLNFISQGPGRCYDLAMCYRKVQLIANLVNNCYQVFVWPTYEIISSIGIMALLYALLIFDQYLNGLFKVVLIITIVTMACVVWVPLIIGSQCLCVSKFIIFKLQQKKNNVRGVDKWKKRFLKSSTPITLRIGPFHAMNKKRIPCLIRFILQRTFFLVLKTKRFSYYY